VQDQADSPLRLIVGLGNPGRRYAGTRHNVGFEVVAALVKLWNASGPRNAFGGVVYDARPARANRLAGTARVVLLQPHTFMNCSGRAVSQLVSFYKADPANLLIVLDDLALRPGRLRVRRGGSAGGHNGLDDVTRALGTREVPRLRIGIGAAPQYMDPADYVLQRFGEDEIDTMRQTVGRAAKAVEDWVFNGTVYVMDTYNRTTEPGDSGLKDKRNENPINENGM